MVNLCEPDSLEEWPSSLLCRGMLRECLQCLHGLDVHTVHNVHTILERIGGFWWSLYFVSWVVFCLDRFRL